MGLTVSYHLCSLQIYNLTNKLSNYLTVYQLVSMALGVALFNLTPLYNDYKMGAFTYPRPRNLTLDFAVFFSLPGYVQDDHFYITATYSAYSASYCGIILCMLDLLLCFMAIQIIGHIKVLMLDFETMERPQKSENGQFVFAGTSDILAVEVYNAAENDAIHMKLIEMVNHHKLIVR